ncbi:MAG: hypothetical protein LBE84_09880, partial [Planctomycetota bacterium]|nr:hypothetical protein [Planctomycetota bacterium]
IPLPCLASPRQAQPRRALPCLAMPSVEGHFPASPAAATIARIPARIASGKIGQAAAILATSGDSSGAVSL